MKNTRIPFLCGGTFFVQVLRSRKSTKTHTELAKGQKKASLNRNCSGGLFQFISLQISVRQAPLLRPMPAFLNNAKRIYVPSLDLTIMINAETLVKTSKKKILKLFLRWCNLPVISLTSRYTSNSPVICSV